MFALPGALLGLVRLFCHQSVLDPTAVSGSNIARALKHNKGWRMPASRDGLVARFRCRGFYRRLAEAVKPRGGGARGSPLSAPKVGCYTTATPRAGCHFDGSPPAREEYDFGPL